MADVPEAYAAFVAMARQLRSMGAVRVRDGGLEVAFGAPMEPELPADERVPRAMERVVSKDEREELEDLRRYKRMAEEVP